MTESAGGDATPPASLVIWVDKARFAEGDSIIIEQAGCDTRRARRVDILGPSSVVFYPEGHPSYLHVRVALETESEVIVA